jgi:formamidopyrimidine-DNA glycosylase
MPELPEVETVSRAIDRHAKGYAVSKITFYRHDLREEIPVAPFTRVLLKREIKSVFRRSKYILMETSGGFGIFHLGMTGNFLVESTDKPLKPHTHLIMQLKKAS